MNFAYEKLIRMTIFSVAILSILSLSACESIFGAKHLRPISQNLEFKMEQRSMSADAPIMVRIFKEENELEVWKEDRKGAFAHLETFDICAWSGEIGPKFQEGDRQSPEGFYSVSPGQMNPKSSYHLSYNIGYPNSFDRALGRTGSHIMVHGDCTSRGCFAMEDGQMEQIYALAREAFKGGQKEFQVQSYPFRMTAKKLAKKYTSPHYEFWQNLKEGYDHFEITKIPPDVDVCDRKYVFNATPIRSGQKFRPAAACPDYAIPTFIASSLKHRKNQYAKVLDFELSKMNPVLLAFVNPDYVDDETENRP